MTYIELMTKRLIDDGCDVSEEFVDGQSATIGYKREVRALTKAHVFVVATERESVDEVSVRTFTLAALRLASARKGQWRGFQSSVLVMSVIVTSKVDPQVAATMRKPFRLSLGGFAALAQPAIVDHATQQVLTFRGTRFWGYAFNGLIRQKVERYLSTPHLEN